MKKNLLIVVTALIPFLFALSLAPLKAKAECAPKLSVQLIFDPDFFEEKVVVVSFHAVRGKMYSLQYQDEIGGQWFNQEYFEFASNDADITRYYEVNTGPQRIWRIAQYN